MKQQIEIKPEIVDLKRKISQCVSAYSADYERQFQDKLFMNGDQWDHVIAKKRNGKKRPTPVLNITRKHVEGYVTQLRMNPFGINVDGMAEKKTLDVLRAKIRKIERKGRFKEVVENAFEDACSHGRGFVVVETDYMDKAKTKACIRYRMINDFRSVMLGPHRMVDGSDAKYAIWIDSVERKGNESSTCNYAYVDLDIPEGNVGSCTLYQLEEKDGETQCHIYKYVGDELEDDMWLPIDCLPVVPFYGVRYTDQTGHSDWTGEVSRVRDVATAINYYYASEIELASKAPKAPLMVAQQQIEGLEDQLKSLATEDPSAIVYKAIALANGQMVPVPQRLDNTAQTQWLIQSVEASMRNFASITGVLNDPTAGMGGTSGKDSLIRGSVQEKGSSPYLDNGAQSIEQLGRVTVKLMPTTYDYPEIIEVENDNGEVERVQVNISQLAVDWGDVDVEVSAGPAYESRRKENLDRLITLAQASGNFALVADLIASDLDTPNAKKIAKRFASMLPPEARDNKEMDQETMQLIQTAQSALQAEQQKAQMLEQALMATTQQLESERFTSKSNAEAMLLKADLDNQTKITIARINSQTDLLKQQMANDAKAGSDQAGIEKTLLTIEADAEKQRQKAIADFLAKQAEAPPAVVVTNDQFAGIPDSQVYRDTGAEQALMDLNALTDGQNQTI